MCQAKIMASVKSMTLTSSYSSISLFLRLQSSTRKILTSLVTGEKCKLVLGFYVLTGLVKMNNQKEGLSLTRTLFCFPVHTYRLLLYTHLGYHYVLKQQSKARVSKLRPRGQMRPGNDPSQINTQDK